MVSSRNSRNPAAFTLIELLVAMAVLAILLVVTSRIVDLVSRNIRSSSSSMDAATAAARVFERIGLDLNLVIRRADVANAADDSATEFLTLLADVPNEGSAASDAFFPTGEGEPAVVHYRLADDSGAIDPARAGFPVVARAAFGALRADSLGMRNATDPTPLPTPSTSGGLRGAGDYDVLATGVVKVAVGYIDKNTGAYTPADGTNLRNHAALVVTLAVIDDNELLKATPGDIAATAAALPAPAAGDDPVSKWTTRWEGGAPAGIPPHVWAAVRFYQRTYSL